jgi:drug/metabolite transporter (DMT)-like permease
MNTPPDWLWIVATLVAVAAQTGRNATQRGLIAQIGTAGATQVRFLYGLPFSVLFLVLALRWTGEALPSPDGDFLIFLVAGSVAQILATALMLAAMRERGFALVTAYTKTEPVQVALVGFVLLGDLTTPVALAAIVVATAGVVLLAWRPGAAQPGVPFWRPMALGLASGACFAMAAVGFRGAILSLDQGSFLMRASTTLVWSLGVQTLLLGLYMVLRDRAALVGSLRVWRASLIAGGLGAFASQCWFIGFSLTQAAHVRALGLVEVLLAALVGRQFMGQAVSSREGLGLFLVVAGVALLLLGHR